jgi:hypothetical protein
MVETIPLGGELETMDVELPSSDQLPKRMKAAIRESLASDAPPPRMAPPSPTKDKKIEYGGKSVPFRGSRTIAAAIFAVIGVAFAGGFGWWYLGTVKELDVAADVAVERRSAVIAKAARPLSSESLAAKPAGAKTANLPQVEPKKARVKAPMTSEINGMVLGIVSAKLGPLDGGDGQTVLAIGLRMTNNSTKPMRYTGWSRPEIKPTLRDGYGNFFNRVSLDTIGTESTINPGDTITDRLVYEKTTFMSDLRLDLPLSGSDQQFEFTIPADFIERLGGRPPVTAGGAPPQRFPDAPSGSRSIGDATSGRTPPPPTVQQSPPTPEKYDPENDEKLCARLRSDYKEKMAEINRRRLGMSSNESNLYRRRETAKLIKKLATDNDLTEDQVKRMIGLK